MSTYTVSDLYTAAGVAGFAMNTELPTAVAISLAENPSRNPAAVSPVNSDGSHDLGAWQINDKANADIIHQYGDPFNLQDNARMAYAVYKRQGWSAWTTYNDGAYKSHLTGKAPYPGKVAQALHNSPLNGLQAVGTFLAHLSDPSLWKRIGLGALGVLVLILGIMFMTESSKTARNLTKVAAVA